MAISETRRPARTGVGNGTANGTFGELLQGELAQPSVDFLVTLPIGLGSKARFRYDPKATEVRVSPSDRAKARTLVESMLRMRCVEGGGSLTIDNRLPLGKGLASSSADLVAAARAVGRALGWDPTPVEIEGLLREIEPSDGVMYPETVAFCHREVRLLSQLGQLPPLTIVGVDEGGSVDTVAFNRAPKDYSDFDRRDYRHLLRILEEAIPRHDAVAIGAVATRSAVLNQRLLPKRSLSDVMDVSLMVGGLGVAVAHSGTMLGILLDESDSRYRHKLRTALRACSDLAFPTSVYYTATPRRKRGPAHGYAGESDPIAERDSL